MSFPVAFEMATTPTFWWYLYSDTSSPLLYHHTALSNSIFLFYQYRMFIPNSPFTIEKLHVPFAFSYIVLRIFPSIAILFEFLKIIKIRFM